MRVRLLWAINVILMMAGGFLMFIASGLTGFSQDLVLGLGTNLVVVPLVFAIHQWFGVNEQPTPEILQDEEVNGKSTVLPQLPNFWSRNDFPPEKLGKLSGRNPPPGVVNSERQYKDDTSNSP